MEFPPSACRSKTFGAFDRSDLRKPAPRRRPLARGSARSRTGKIDIFCAFSLAATTYWWITPPGGIRMRPTAIFAAAVWLAPAAGLASAHLATPADVLEESASIVLWPPGSETPRLARLLEVPIGPPDGLFPRSAGSPSFQLPLFESSLFESLASRHSWASPPPRAAVGTPPVPEPSTGVLLGLGLVGLAWGYRERRNRHLVSPADSHAASISRAGPPAPPSPACHRVPFRADRRVRRSRAP